MLSVYTRHYPPCRQTDSNYRRCRCPKWINGTLATGTFIRESAQTRSWETAERKARLMEIDADPLRKAPPEPNWENHDRSGGRRFPARRRSEETPENLNLPEQLELFYRFTGLTDLVRILISARQ